MTKLTRKSIFRAFRFFGGQDGLIFVILAITALIYVGSLVGGTIQVRVAQHPTSQLGPTAISLTPPPRWLLRDVRKDLLSAIRLSSLDSIVDPDCASKVAELASNHPWIAQVLRVAVRYPSTISIEVEYRRPVCALTVGSRTFLLDATGIVLPAEDVTPELRDSLYWLVDSGNWPHPRVGERFPDGRAVESARLAEFLGPEIAAAGFRFIHPQVQANLLEPDEIHLTLLESTGRAIRWGHPPGREAPGELPAAEKRRLLLEQIGTRANRHTNIGGMGF